MSDLTSIPSSSDQRPDRWRWMPFVMLISGIAAFVLIAADVVCQGRLSQWDHPIQVRLHEFARASSDNPGEIPPGVILFSAISGLGEFKVVAAAGVTAGILLALRKRWHAILACAVALVGSGAINSVLKSMFRVPRPSEHTFFTPHGGWSFPSGHTMAVAITAGALALVLFHLAPLRPLARWAITVAVIFLALLEAFALMYVGVHYLTDVLGALAVSLAWLGIIAWLLPPARLSASHHGSMAA